MNQKYLSTIYVYVYQPRSLALSVYVTRAPHFVQKYVSTGPHGAEASISIAVSVEPIMSHKYSIAKGMWNISGAPRDEHNITYVHDVWCNRTKCRRILRPRKEVETSLLCCKTWDELIHHISYILSIYKPNDLYLISHWFCSEMKVNWEWREISSGTFFSSLFES